MDINYLQIHILYLFVPFLLAQINNLNIVWKKNKEESMERRRKSKQLYLKC